MTVLITGATGAVGRHLVAELQSRQVAVRALTRRPESAGLPADVDVVAADLDDATSLHPALFAGVDAAFVFPAGGALSEFVEAAVAGGVRRFVVLSSLAVSERFPRDRHSTSHRHHAAVERAVATRTDDWTVLRPGSFANNLLSWSFPIRSGLPIRAPYLRSAQAPIHEADIAAVAAVALTESGFTGRVLELNGPHALTRSEQVAAIGRAIERDIPVQEITPDEFRADVGRFVPDEVIDMLLAHWHDTVESPDEPFGTTEAVTGRPGRTFDEWARDHADAFRPAPVPVG